MLHANLRKGNKAMSTCQICGAARDPLLSNCSYCGTAYQLTNITGETYITALKNVLERIDELALTAPKSSKTFLETITDNGSPSAVVQAKVSAISTFAMPADVESLMQFLAFCHGLSLIHI